MLIASDTRHYVAVNDAACRLFGLSADQILRRRIDDFTPPEQQSVLPIIWAQFLEAGTQAGTFDLRIGQKRIEVEFAATANIAPGQHLSILLTPVRKEAPADAEPGTPRRNSVLTDREREVLSLLAHGKSAEDAAATLDIARNTVQNHLRSARAKLGARTRSHAIVLAIRHGEIPLDGSVPGAKETRTER
jgi:DNA-binding CsgD family transcriptional regulator